jgi:hypothetical protein
MKCEHDNIKGDCVVCDIQELVNMSQCRKGNFPPAELLKEIQTAWDACRAKYPLDDWRTRETVNSLLRHINNHLGRIEAHKRQCDHDAMEAQQPIVYTRHVDADSGIFSDILMNIRTAQLTMMLRDIETLRKADD